jgi:hypothetical protein
MQNRTRRKKTSLDQALFGIVLQWFYAELCKAQKDKPWTKLCLGLFEMVLSMQNCVVLCRTVQGTKRQAWTELHLGLLIEWFHAEPCKVQKDKPGPSSFGGV